MDIEQRAKEPFVFVGCVELQKILGERAQDEEQLVDLLEQVPLDSIYYHTHSYFLRHKYIPTPYTNDFANWSALEVRDQVLAEKLAVVDPFEFDSLEPLRDELISVIDEHLARMAIVPRVVFGEPFYFKQSAIIEVPTGLQARTLGEFWNALSEVDASAIYFHLLEARMRLNRPEGDFSVWLRESLGLPELAKKVQAINPYLGSLERLRSKLLIVLDEFIRKEG
ncbi:MAG: hypothetical protein HY347_08130 [candidate division NC10 bacterium]|nr:hypothetical protein [candidate division NC10 bacterium]